jgi:hypothetical protein
MTRKTMFIQWGANYGIKNASKLIKGMIWELQMEEGEKNLGFSSINTIFLEGYKSL